MTVEATELRNPSSPERQRPVVGVWLMILNGDRLFVVENLKSKFESQKLPEQWNSPAETYRPDLDQISTNGVLRGSFQQGTIARAIEEEIGILTYDPSKVKPLRFISIHGIGYPVIAAPFLIPVDSERTIEYKPKDNENGATRWAELDEILGNPQMTVNGVSVPLFRSPMVEIAQNIREAQAGLRFRAYPFATVEPTVSRDLVDSFPK